MIILSIEVSITLDQESNYARIKDRLTLHVHATTDRVKSWIWLPGGVLAEIPCYIAIRPNLRYNIYINQRIRQLLPKVGIWIN